MQNHIYFPPPKIILIYLKTVLISLSWANILLLNLFSPLFYIAFETGMKTE